MTAGNKVTSGLVITSRDKKFVFFILYLILIPIAVLGVYVLGMEGCARYYWINNETPRSRPVSERAISCAKSSIVIEDYSAHFARKLGLMPPLMPATDTTSSQETTPKEKDFYSADDKNIIATAVQHFLDIYKNVGATGVKAELNECYAKANTKGSVNDLLYCLAFDTVASGIISLEESNQHWPATPEFSGASYDVRIRENLVKADIQNAYQQTKVIAQLKQETSKDFTHLITQTPAQ